MRDTHAVQLLGCLPPHLGGHDAVPKNPLGREEAGKHRGFRDDAPFVVAEDKPVMQVRRDDAELGAQLEDVPAVVAKHTYRRCAVGRRDRTILEREQPDELRFSGPIGAENGGVLVGLDGECEAVKDGMLALDDRCVVKLKNRRRQVTPAAAGRAFPSRTAAGSGPG